MLRTHGLLRYPAHGARSPDQPEVEGLPNFFYWTHCADGGTQAQLESGINPMRAVVAPDGARRPVITIRSSPRRAGTAGTPWHDAYDMDGGRIRYFGDSKSVHMPNPRSAPGNRALLETFDQHSSPDPAVRLRAAPLAFFVTSRPGIVEFCGIGLIESVELVTQTDPRTGLAFSNYAYDCCLVSLANEGETLDWSWITNRRDAFLTASEANICAPRAWTEWATKGSEALNRVRRVVSRQRTVKTRDQLPDPGSPEEGVLAEIYRFYSDSGNSRKHRFEALAELISDFVMRDQGGRYHQGWITRGTGDHGVDFVARLDVGVGFSSTSLVVLGQAKCEAPGGTTSGRDIARTVARLRRGWIGCYVTTGTISERTQEEVIEDRYPIVLIPGREVARAVRALALRDGISPLQLLQRVDDSYLVPRPATLEVARPPLGC